MAIMKKQTARLLLVIVAIVSLVGVFFVYPTSVFSGLYNTLPWRLGLDLVGGSYLTYKVDLTEVSPSDVPDVVAGLRDVIENRVNSFGVKEPRVTISQTGGDHFLNIELAGIKDVKSAIQEIGQTPFLQFYEQGNTDQGQNFVPTDLTGRYVKGAQIAYDQTSGRPYIYLELKGKGIKMFEDLTRSNVGKPLAIFLDGNLLSAPTVQEAISGGKAQISGDFTLTEVQKLVRNLNIGALPAPIHLVNQQTVGASLGSSSLRASLIAGAIGTGLIILFMSFYYGVLGLLASLALLIYVILSLSIFKLFVTMSLAGIAGFLLSIGMAVDANILIFERTKEELSNGVSRSAAIREGFRRAWPSIRDSNVSTMITSLILFYSTTSFVRGLALTLLLGVIVSMFTAIIVTRGLMIVFLSSKASEE